jgi:hypothetical protein
MTIPCEPVGCTLRGNKPASQTAKFLNARSGTVLAPPLETRCTVAGNLRLGNILIREKIVVVVLSGEQREITLPILPITAI